MHSLMLQYLLCRYEKITANTYEVVCKKFTTCRPFNDEIYRDGRYIKRKIKRYVRMLDSYFTHYRVGETEIFALNRQIVVFVMAAHLAWRDMNLNDTTTPFNPDYIYRMYAGGWLMATTISSTALFFFPSTAGKYYGCVHYTHKSEWEYRMQGNSAQRPVEYPGYMGNVERLQYLVVENGSNV